MQTRSWGILSLTAATLLSANLYGQTPGAKIQIREGDVWSEATVVRKEGRRTLVKYDDGTEEWVMPDRIKGSGASPASPAAPADPAAAAAERARQAMEDARARAGLAPDKGVNDAANAAAERAREAAERARGNAPQTGVKPNAAAAIEISLDNVPPSPFDPTGLPQVTAKTKVRDFAPVQLNTNANRLHLAPDTNILIIEGNGAPGAQRGKAVLKVDLGTSKVLGQQTIDVHFSANILGVGEGGKYVISETKESFASLLQVWESAGSTYRPKVMYKTKAWANFTTMPDADHLIFRTVHGDMYLVDMKTSQATAWVKVHGNSEPVLHPSGKLLACLDGEGNALVIRTSDLAIVGQVGGAARLGFASIDPSGTLIAFQGARNTIQVAKIAGAEVIGSIPVKPGNEPPMLLSAESLLYGNIFYEVKTGMPVWTYHASGKKVMLGSGQVGYVLTDGRPFALAVSLPDPAATKALKSPATGQFAMSPGASVRILGDFSAFGEEEEAALLAVENAVTNAGFKVDPNEKTRILNVSIAPGNVEQMQFRQGGGGPPFGPPMGGPWGPPRGPFGPGGGGDVKNYSVPSTIIKATLSVDGKAVWEFSTTATIAAGQTVQRNDEQSVQDAINAAARPKAAHFNQMFMPAYIPAGAAPGGNVTLGASSITIRGFGAAPEQPKQQQPQTPTTPIQPTTPARGGKQV